MARIKKIAPATFSATMRLLPCLVVLVASAPPVHADALQAGLWKIITTPEIDGVAGDVQESTRCLTEEEVGNLEVTFSPNSRTINSACENVESNTGPQRLSWRLRCAGQIDIDVSGEFTFDAPDHYTGSVTTHASMTGQRIPDSRASIDARYVGACSE